MTNIMIDFKFILRLSETKKTKSLFLSPLMFIKPCHNIKYDIIKQK